MINKAIMPRKLTFEQAQELILCFVSFANAVTSTLDAHQMTAEQKVSELHKLSVVMEKTVLSVTTGNLELVETLRALYFVTDDKDVSAELAAQITDVLKRYTP